MILVKQTDSLLVFRAFAGSNDKYLEFSTVCLKESMMLILKSTIILENDIKSDVDLKWSMNGLSTEKIASDERIITTIMYKFGISQITY